MGRFRHTADNVIFINDTYLPLSFFITQEPTYSLPIGMISRDYEQGAKDVLSDGSTSYGYGIPYTDGDTYISKEAIYSAAYVASLLPVYTLSETKERKISRMLEYCEAKKSGHVIVGTNEFFSSYTFLQKLMADDSCYTRVGSLPGGYYVNDVSYVKVSISALGDLRAIIDRIIELHHVEDLVADDHRIAINALTSIDDVNSYDYTVGWVTVPY